jgi:hypothetical protein
VPADDSSTADTSVSSSVPPAQGGVAPSGDTPWWKKSENIIPILSGLAAMGSAKTVHPGVALAEGLGAGAQSYLSTRASQAKTAAEQQKARAIEIANQLNTVKNQAVTDAISGKGPYAQQLLPGAKSPPADPGKTAADIDQNARTKFAVQPITQQEADYNNRMAALSAATGNPQWKDMALQRQQQRVTAQTFDSQQRAQHENAALLSIMNDARQPKEIRDAATAQYNANWQFTGEKIEERAGLLRSSVSGAPTAGAQAQTFTPQQLWDQWRTLNAPTDTGAQEKIPFWQFAAEHGVKVPTNWSPTGTAQAPPNSTTTAPPARAPRALASPPAGEDFSDAPAKPSWLGNPRHIVTPEEEPIAKGYGEKELELRSEAAQLPNTQRELIKAQRVLSLLPNAKTGPGTDTMSAVQTALGNMTGSQFVSWLNSNPSAHALLQKQLGSNALETTLRNLREAGANVRLGQQESNLIINRLSASAEMPKDAIRSLMQWQIQEAQWQLGRQKAIPTYLSQGKSALDFDNYYGTKHPLSSVLTAGAPAGTTLPQWQIVPPKTITGKADYDALPSGSVYLWQGRRGVKP